MLFFLCFLKNSLNNIDMTLVFLYNINQDVITVNYYKNIEFFGKDLIDVTLKTN